MIIRNDQCDVNEREQTLKVKYDLSYEKKIINQKHLNKNDRTTALHIFIDLWMQFLDVFKLNQKLFMIYYKLGLIIIQFIVKVM